MSDNLAKELAVLPRLGVADLRRRYAEVFGETTRTGNKAWLVKRLAWRLQALAEGDLSQRARQRAAELANDADLRLSPPRAVATNACPAAIRRPVKLRLPPCDRLPPPGTILHRPYKGEVLQVEVLQGGFAFQGKVYKTLSAVAKAITGSHCNGYLFFRINEPGVAS
jgi:Protein of unknown function (DUF2924)